MTPTSTRRRLGLAAVVASLALTFTACGASGDDDKADTTTTTTAGTTTSEATTTTAANETTTTSGDDTTTTAPDETTTTGPGTTANGFAKDAIVKVYKQMGMSEKQANCAADYVVSKMGDISGKNLSSLGSIGQELIKKCDINPTDLKMPSNLGGN